LIDWDTLLGEARSCRDWLRYSALARRAEKLRRTDPLPERHVPVRIALMGGNTTDLVARPLKLALTVQGLAPELLMAPYDQIHQELLDPQSATALFDPRIAVVLPSSRTLTVWPDERSTAAQAAQAAEAAVDELLRPLASLHQRQNTEFVLSTFLPPLRRPHGNLSGRLPSDPTSFLRRVNLVLQDVAPPYVHLLDLAGLGELRGLERLMDARVWHQAKAPVSPEFVPELAQAIAAVVGGALGRSKKVLVLDLDNTLWGGVIGDDGVEGIELGEGSALGEAYKAVQQYARALKNRGVLLAVASKNEVEAARLPFLSHPESVLSLEDFAAFKANWDPKSDNLRAIAQELDLGLDAFVFLDDNPAERAEVASALPEVVVIDGSSDPVDMLDALDRGRWFEVTAVTGEDLVRSDMYRARQQAASLEASTRDMSEFLSSLEMQALLQPFQAVDLERITQLVNKTNQFNLTTHRLTKSDIEAIAASDEWICRTARLSDRFGDHGLIAVVMGQIEGTSLVIRNWLMSCRVLKRGVEQLLLNEFVRAAQAQKLRELRGRYVPTPRNALVADLYPDLGFERAGSEEGGTTHWRLAVANHTPVEHFIGWKDPSCTTQPSSGTDSSKSSETSSKKSRSNSVH